MKRIWKRHICNCCKRKLYEQDMEETNRETRYGKKVWICFKCKGMGKNVSVY